MGGANILFGTGASSGGGGGLPGVTDPFVAFTVGDAQVGTPTNGQTQFAVTTFNGQNLFNKRLLVLREGIGLNYNTPVANNGEIARYNSGGEGGFVWQGGGYFATGDRYQIYIIGVDNTVET